MVALRADDGRLTKNGRLLQQLRIDPEQREDHPGSRWRSWIVGATLLILVLAAGAVTAFMLRRGDAFKVETATAIAPSGVRDPAATLQASGYVAARRQATVSAQITGAITEVLIEEGDYVEVGQVLTPLEDTAQKASLAQAQAQVRATHALLDQFEAQLAQARRDLRRNEDLVFRQLASTQALENAHTQVETLQAQVHFQQRQIELAQTAVRGAEVQLAYTTVRAPFSGVVIAKTAQAGEIISPISAGGGFTRTGICTIVDMDSLEIEVEVSEAYINRVKPLQPVQAILDAYSNWTIPAHVIAIVPTADRSKATVKVRIAIEQKDPRILPDMGVRVSFRAQAPTGAQKLSHSGKSEQPVKGVLVPSSAVVERDGQNVVFTTTGDHAHSRRVALGQTYGELRLVEGIPNGAIVVRTPSANMNDGDRVVIKKQ